MCEILRWFENHELWLIFVDRDHGHARITSIEQLASFANVPMRSVNISAKYPSGKIELPGELARLLPKSGSVDIGPSFIFNNNRVALTFSDFAQLPETITLVLRNLMIETWKGLSPSLKRLQLIDVNVAPEAGLLRLASLPALEYFRQTQAMSLRTEALDLVERAIREEKEVAEIVEELHELGAEEWAHF